MNSFSALIIDDEPKACRFLNSIIDEFCEEINEIHVSTNPLEAIDIITKNNPDILFLDINMPNLSGFELLEKITNFNGYIVFTTAHSEFAIKAFKYNAFDYLLKPFKVDDLISTVQRILKKEERQSASEVNKKIQALTLKENHQSIIAIHDKGGLVFIKTKDIFYLESQSNYTDIHCKDKCYTSSKTSKNFENILDPDLFVRIHKSYIVNMDHVMSYKVNGDKNSIEMSNEVLLPVSRRRRTSLNRFSI